MHKSHQEHPSAFDQLFTSRWCLNDVCVCDIVNTRQAVSAETRLRIGHVAFASLMVLLILFWYSFFRNYHCNRCDYLRVMSRLYCCHFSSLIVYVQTTCWEECLLHVCTGYCLCLWLHRIMISQSNNIDTSKIYFPMLQDSTLLEILSSTTTWVLIIIFGHELIICLT